MASRRGIAPSHSGSQSRATWPQLWPSRWWVSRLVVAGHAPSMVSQGFPRQLLLVRHSHLHGLALQVVLPLFGMDADPSYDPEEDWEADCKGRDVMMYPDFFDSLFELADMW